MGWTIDYGDVKELFEPAYLRLDHHPLNEVAGLGTGDSVGLLHWMRDSMIETLPPLDRIDVYETPGCGAILSWGQRGPALPL